MVLEIKASTDFIVKDTDLRHFGVFFGLVPECITSYLHIFFAFKMKFFTCNIICVYSGRCSTLCFLAFSPLIYFASLQSVAPR